ncbi:S-adenosyl-L-methionine-dependent methyltransferase [Mycena alexandri]|uniref:S-adenosyl-L-methionine-dependent methyltransferase n=1 Tax=Mycena alexandri TaxID=1745969 RepID=A0AAD6SIG8_9AGAR|nr:S-adenosyl-L-methionine-dependent methyltransferase [Mycena alexandri]
MVDGRERDRIVNYTKFWDKDISKETSAHTENRAHSYEDVVNGYYDGATEFYEYGWAQSFHFSRFYKGEAFAAALARHEHYLAAQMGLRPGMRVLDVGCGVGGPAREIARFADVEVVGLNNNEFQLQRARRYTQKVGLEKQVTFVRGDFMKLEEQFGKNYFDAVYAIEATCHAPSWEGVYGEIFKVLKPGGVFGVYEWCMTDKWDASVPSHAALQHQIELGNGIPEMRPIAAAREAIKAVGFELQHEEDLADRGDHVPWYYPLEGDVRKAQTLWDCFTVLRISPIGKFLTHNAVWVMELLRLVPKGTHDVGEALRTAAVALVRGGQLKIFTPMYLAIARKPEAF